MVRLVDVGCCAGGEMCDWLDVRVVTGLNICSQMWQSKPWCPCSVRAVPEGGRCCCRVQVRCMYAGVGGLDISTYSAGTTKPICLGQLFAVHSYAVEYQPVSLPCADCYGAPSQTCVISSSIPPVPALLRLCCSCCYLLHKICRCT